MSIAAPIDPPETAAAEATRLLYERHAAPMLAFCLRRLGTREEAEDAVQQTFLKAFAAVRGGFVPNAEKPWLYRIAENVCTDRLRSATYRKRHESAPEALAVVAAPAAASIAGIGDALAELGEQQRRALVLREWHGLSYREIARELSVSQSAVETLLFRARRALARRLEAFSFAGWLKSAFAVKVTAAAVATIGVGAVAMPAAVDRWREQPARVEPVGAQTRSGANVARPDVPTRRSRARVSETQAPPTTRAEAGASVEGAGAEPKTAPPAAAQDRTAGAGGSEIQAPAPAVEPLSSPVDELLPPAPATPAVPLPDVPEVLLPAPEDVIEPVGESLPDLPALPTLP